MKSVITAAGKGSRLLPVTKELPKEMLPIFSRLTSGKKIMMPILQLIFEDLFDNGIRNHCFIVGRSKRSIEDHFTFDSSFQNELSKDQKKLITSFYKKIKSSNLVWINQDEPLGFGDAVKRSESYVGTDDFIVHGGDVSILSKSNSTISRMIKTFNANPSVSAMLLCKKITNPKNYGVPEITKINSSLFSVKNVEEKPTKPKSNYGLLPCYVFKPIIFKYLHKLKLGKNNEYQLTDAIQALISDGHEVLAIPTNSSEFELDVGNVDSYFESLNLSYKKC
jgi:UTP--glucose-1-phosphate uridylyltransferase